MTPVTAQSVPHIRAGGFAALYLALAYLTAMPFFLLLVDYQNATTAAEQVTSIVRDYQSLYAMYLVSYVFVGVALAVLVLSLFDRLRLINELVARVTTVLGLTWAISLILSGMVFNHGMGTVVSLAEKSPEQAATAWQSIVTVSEGIGGASGETLGGLWMLLLSVTVLRARALPPALAWLGAATGLIGLASTVPALQTAVYGFGVLQILWFAWLGIALLRHGARTPHLADAEHARIEERAR